MKQRERFETFGLDPRTLKAIAKANFTKPTIVQTAAIPLALKGKDILAKAKTGSGKTAAYAIPILQQLRIICTSISALKQRHFF